jgi:hypothetical protein
MARIRVTRVIVIEGEEGWVRSTLANSLLNYARASYDAPHGTITLIGIDERDVKEVPDET